MAQVHLWPEGTKIEDDQLSVLATVEKPGSDPLQLWFRLPAKYESALAPNCDPFVVAALFSAMRAPADLIVHGEVSPSLLRNLAEYQAIWHAWGGGRYTPIEIRAEIEREAPKAKGDLSVAAFSGGMDSAYTVYRHHRDLVGRRRRDIRAGLFLHGLDIPLNQPEAYLQAAKKAGRMLESLDIEMIPMASNHKWLGIDLDEGQAAILASCMMLLSGKFSSGLIASSYPYADLVVPWGSSPVSDHLLSSAGFPIVHDGAESTRIDKTLALKGWPAALEELRVCVGPDSRYENCCRCDKCKRVILYFRIAGMGLPPAFKQDVSALQLLSIKPRSPASLRTARLLQSIARARGARGAWMFTYSLALLFNSLLVALKERPLVRRLRKRGKRA